MKKIRIGIFFLLLIALFCLICSGCKEPVVYVNYYVDGIKAETPPDHNFYVVQSLDCNNEEANATWNSETWELTYQPVKKDTEINVHFTYTPFPFTIDGIGFETLQDAFSYAAGYESVTIETTANFSGYAASATGTDITLNLNGFILDGAGFDTITCNGKMIINGEGTITNTIVGEYSKSLVNFGALTLNNVNIENGTTNVSVWNSNNGGSTMVMNECVVKRTDDCIVVINSGEMSLNSCTIEGAGIETHPVLYINAEEAFLTAKGGAITNTSTGYSVYLESGTAVLEECEAANSYGLEE